MYHLARAYVYIPCGLFPLSPGYENLGIFEMYQREKHVLDSIFSQGLKQVRMLYYVHACVYYKHICMCVCAKTSSLTFLDLQRHHQVSLTCAERGSLLNELWKRKGLPIENATKVVEDLQRMHPPHFAARTHAATLIQAQRCCYLWQNRWTSRWKQRIKF
jgi:hypothetical protein